MGKIVGKVYKKISKGKGSKEKDVQEDKEPKNGVPGNGESGPEGYNGEEDE